MWGFFHWTLPLRLLIFFRLFFVFICFFFFLSLYNFYFKWSSKLSFCCSFRTNISFVLIHSTAENYFNVFLFFYENRASLHLKNCIIWLICYCGFCYNYLLNMKFLYKRMRLTFGWTSKVYKQHEFFFYGFMMMCCIVCMTNNMYLRTNQKK